MHNHLRHHTGEKETEKTDGKSKVGPVMSVFHYFQCIALEINLAVKIHFVKGLHWYFAFAMVLGFVAFSMEIDIVLNWATRKSSFLIFPRR